MILAVTDLDRCQRLWRGMVPEAGLFDLWDVRACFQREYGYRPHFLVAHEGPEVRGMLALSEIADWGYWGFFPGETYKARTWLEQNRLYADTPETTREILQACPQPAHLRYLTEDGTAGSPDGSLDEVGYLFRPGDYGYSFESYLQAFSGKSRKKLTRELDELKGRGVEFRHDHPADVESAFALNLGAFAEKSYFADERFLAGFRNLARLLGERGMLRVTTVLIAGRIAAVDIGGVYRGVYTVLGGGADPQYLGIAKLINFHHMEWACRERLRWVDFLCGDFGWKERFHLTPRPLYQLRRADEGYRFAFEPAFRPEEVAADAH